MYVHKLQIVYAVNCDGSRDRGCSSTVRYDYLASHNVHAEPLAAYAFPGRYHSTPMPPEYAKSRQLSSSHERSVW